MRATDDRYRGEQARFDLAMKMIRLEARTGTIRYFTGLNDDRIRKLYTTYFKFSEAPVRRQRGRSPTRVAPLVRTPQRALESGVLANLLFANGLLSVEIHPDRRSRATSTSGIASAIASRRSIGSCPAARCHSSGAGTCWSPCGAATSSGSRIATHARSATSSTCCRCRARRVRPVCCSLSAAASSGWPRPGSIGKCASSSSRSAWPRAIRCSSPPIATSSTARPTQAAAWWPERVLGGRDLLAGGTWLAIDERGRFAAVTNVREGQRPIGLRSRGALVAEYLASGDSAARYAAHAAREGAAFGAFNLLVYDGRELHFASNRTAVAHSHAGLHAFSNAPPGTEWPKTATALAAASGLLTEVQPIEPLFALLAERDESGPAELRHQRTHFVVGATYGTRCSTVLLIDTSGCVTFAERTFDDGRQARRRSARELRARTLAAGGRQRGQPRTDRADLLDADRVRHRIRVPLDGIAE